MGPLGIIYEIYANLQHILLKKKLRSSLFMKFDKNYDYRNNFKKWSWQDLQ